MRDFLEHWRKDGHRWTGFVRDSVGVGMTHIGWFDQALIHKIGERQFPEPPARTWHHPLWRS